MKNSMELENGKSRRVIVLLLYCCVENDPPKNNKIFYFLEKIVRNSYLHSTHSTLISTRFNYTHSFSISFINFDSIQYKRSMYLNNVVSLEKKKEKEEADI